MMTPDEWESIALLLEEGWPGEFTDDASKAWRVLLDGFSATDILIALREMTLRGGKFRPSVSEVAAQIRQDPSRPTFDEAYQQLYGPGGVFGFRRSGVTISPWIEAFVADYGRDRLRMLEVDHDEFGELKRRELRQSYEQFLEASEGREIAAIAQGRRAGGLKQFDPLSVLPGRSTDLASVGELEAGR